MFTNEVDISLRPFFQGEILVPDRVPPHLIKIPNVDAFNRSLELHGRLLGSNLEECTLRGETVVTVPKSFSTTVPLLTIAAGAGSSTPEPHVLPIEVHLLRMEKVIT